MDLSHYPLSEKRQAVLEVLYDAGDRPLPTQLAREGTGITSGGVDHHFGRLEDAGLIEEHPERLDPSEGPGPIPSRQWELTDEGRAVVEELLERGEVVTKSSQFVVLQNRINSLEEQLDEERRQRKAELEEVRTHFNQLREYVKENS